MQGEIEQYNALQAAADQRICKRLMDSINGGLPMATGKIWHGSPVWFIDGNPIVGYSKQKSGVQLLFWSGASFAEQLKPVGKFMAAEARYHSADEIHDDDLTRWLQKSIAIQWDYKNVAQRHGELQRL